VKDSHFALVVTLPVALFLLSMVIFPLGYSFFLSLNSFEVRGGGIKQRFIGLDNYIQAISDERVLGGVLRTAVYAAEAIPLTLGIALATALILYEAFPGRGLLRVLALLPWAISEFATGIVWKWVWIEGFGFVNGVLMNLRLIERPINFITTDTAIHLIAVAQAWHVAPLGAFFLLAGLQVIPEDLLRQARIDGAGAVRRFFQVKVPFIRYAILITLVIATLLTMTSLDVVMLLTGGGPGIASQTLTYVVYRETFALFNLGYGAAISYILLGVIMVIAIVWFQLLVRRR